MKSIQGLSEKEATARRKRGEGNDIRLQTSRTYHDIFRQNVFAFINMVLFVIGALLIAIGRIEDAVVSLVLIVANVVIGVYQEVRAKRQLDRIALLTRPQVTVIRDGRERAVDPAEVVLGDTLTVRQGDQIVVDGEIIAGKMEVDESLLSGESDLILKAVGDRVLSGSFCVTGKSAYEATRVGLESYANRLTADARIFRVVQTPLQREVDFIIRLLTVLALFIGMLLLVSAVVFAIPLMRSVQMAAVIAGLVPNGLFLMLIVAYAMGALRIVRCGALVQQSNSVESLSYVNMLCLDKTGTLTANRIRFHDAAPIGIEKGRLLRLLGDFAKNASDNNRTGEAIAAAMEGQERRVVDEAPFSSARKWSGLSFEDEDMRGAYVLGAVETLRPNLQSGLDLLSQVESWTDAGLRVLLFAFNPDVKGFYDESEQPHLPLQLIPLGVLSFSDELRPELKGTLEGFNEAGINLKIVSGDNPQMVASLVKQAGLPLDSDVIVSGTELEKMNDAQFAKMAEVATIFGRISPVQKEKLVGALRKRGYYVAMIGDGVNDVLSLKKANLGIAMQGGSAATRSVADMVLLNNSFESLPPAFIEGQRIINGMKDILRLFLTRALYFALLILSTAVIGIGFPYVPKHATLVSFFTVGIPTFALAVWARPGSVPRRGLVRTVMHFVIPATVSTFIFGLVVYTSAYGMASRELGGEYLNISTEEINRFRASAGIDYEIESTEDYIAEVATQIAQSALTTFTLAAGLILLIFVEPPTRFFVGGDVFSGDKRPTLLTLVLFIVFLGVLFVEPLREFFEILLLPSYAYVFIGLLVVGWALTLRHAWRARWLNRFLGY